MDADKIKKLERCIRLTESSNDHEALNALRIAQGICKKAGAGFADTILKGTGSHTNINQAELQRLRQEVSHLDAKYHRVCMDYSDLHTEYIELQRKHAQKTKAKKTKKKNSTTKDPVAELESLKRKYKQLQKDYEELEEEQEENYERNNIIEGLFEGTEKDKENTLRELVEEFIHSKHITVSELNWTSSTALYKSFVNSVDFQVMSNKKFSQLFSSILGVKALKGGKLKNLMGFPVHSFGIS